MSIDIYLEGTRVEVVANVATSAGVLTDPTTATFTISRDGVIVDTLIWPAGPGTFTHPATGVIVLEWDADVPGRHKVHIQTTGQIKAPSEKMFEVEESHVV